MWCINPPEFKPNDRVASLVFHPPEIMPGTAGTIVRPYTGSLFAVQLPGGELHRWFAQPELEPVEGPYLVPGSHARVVSTEGHGPEIQMGMIVKIVKVLGNINYYDLMIDGHGYHRWLAEFEIIPLALV